MSAGGRGATTGRCVLSRLFALAGTPPYARAMPIAHLAQRGATASSAEIRSLTVKAFPDRGGGSGHQDRASRAHRCPPLPGR
jgi:hypothetical protein